MAYTGYKPTGTKSPKQLLIVLFLSAFLYTLPVRAQSGGGFSWNRGWFPVFLFFAAGLLLIYILTRRRRDGRQETPAPAADSNAQKDELVSRLQQELDFQQRLIQDVIDNVPMVVFIKDVRGRYRLVNKKMLELLRLEQEDLLGKTDAHLQLSPERLASYRQADELVLREGRTISLNDQVDIDGTRHYYRVTKLPLKDAEGNVQHICGIAADITEFKEAEQKLTHARDEAEQAKSVQETFLANISHEIRTPMNGIIGMTGLLSQTPLTDTQREYTESIRISASSLLALINDLLDVSKIRSGKFQLEQIDFPLEDVIGKVIFPLQFKAEEKGISLQLHYKTEVPPRLKGDPLRLQQIIINLVNNAIKFTKAGSVDLDIWSEPVTTKMIKLRVDVRDTGIGIPAHRLGEIFDLYTQSENHTARLYGGTGLGLNIVKQLLELQSGKVWVSSEEGKGSVFSFEIPYEVSHTDIESIPDGPADDSMPSGLEVLVADDNAVNQKVAQYVLERQGARVTLVDNGREAVTAVSAGRFDIILMDMQMPEMDGFAAMRYIRTELKLEIPIIAMTANALRGEAEKCLEAGANAYISKPFDQHILYQQISALVRGQNDTQMSGKTTDSSKELVDFSYIEELSGGKPDYMRQVLTIFMDNTYPGVDELERLVRSKADFEPISKQAHFLKSSVGIIKIRDMYDTLKQIEILGKEGRDREEIERLLEVVLDTFGKAKPIIQKRMKGK